MAEERYRHVVTSHLFLVKDGRILLLRRFNTGYEDGNYSVVAGHVEEGETARETIAREAEEEAGIEIDVGNLEVLHVMHRKGKPDERIDFFMTAKEWSGEPEIKEPGKCDDLRWFGLNELPPNVIPYIRQAINCFLEKKIYSEFGWEDR